MRHTGPRSTRKTLKREGRISHERRLRRAKWIREHPPNHQGAWVCFWCRQWVYRSDMEVGHKYPKSSTGKVESESDKNLGPIHTLCNREQSSTKYEEPTILRQRGDEW